MNRALALGILAVAFLVLLYFFAPQDGEPQGIPVEVGGMELPDYYGRELIDLQDYQALREFMDGGK